MKEVMVNLRAWAIPEGGHRIGTYTDDRNRLRIVSIEEEELRGLDKIEKLETVFYYGQNDVQPTSGLRSVSSGDIILWQDSSSPKEYWKVTSEGFKQLTEEEYNKDVSKPYDPFEWVKSD